MEETQTMKPVHQRRLMQINGSIEKYFELLNDRNYDGLMKHMNNGKALVSSSSILVGGDQRAREFYRNIFDKSREETKFNLINTYVSLYDPFRGSANFECNWVPKNGEESSFKGADFFEFNEESLITKLKIIYNTRDKKWKNQ